MGDPAGTAAQGSLGFPSGFEYDIEQMVRGIEAAAKDSSLPPERIKVIERMLARLSQGEHDLSRAALLNEMGTAATDRATGDRGTNVEMAIVCYAEALRAYTPEAAPMDYAKTQHDLGAAYAQLPTGDRNANLERAIACYTEALRFFTPQAAPMDYAMTQHNLGAAYTYLPTGDRAANLEQAIAFYTEALRFYTPEAAPLDYARTQHNLGVAYAEFPTGDRAANLEQAIGFYTEALRFRTPQAAPLDYATTQSALGGAYGDLPTNDPAANLERATACFTEALRFHTAQAAPLDYAGIQYRLGATYTRLRTGDRGANLERAIVCYMEALRAYTPEAAPLDYAMTQSGLGTAYGQLPTGDRAANVDRTITCYTEALRFYTPEAAPLDYASTQRNLGAAYADLPGGDRAANLERAITCYTEALRFYTPEAAPLDYASTQRNLGAAYADLPTGDRAANLERAITCYTEALRFLTPQAAPLQYATCQNGLGAAYAGLPTGDRAANLEQAIAFYTEALRFYTIEGSPNEHRMSAANLGLLHFNDARWEEAHAAYESAIRAGNLLYQATATEAGRQVELEGAGDLVTNDAYCLARLLRVTEAVERLEGGRARALSEGLARDRAALDLATPEDQEAFAAARDRITALDAEARDRTEAALGAPAKSYVELSDDLAAARRDLQSVVDRIQGYIHGFMAEDHDYRSIRDVSSPDRPVVYLIATTAGSLALIVPAGMDVPDGQDHLLWLNEFDSETLNGLLVEPDVAGAMTGGYVVAQMTGDAEVLAAALERVLPTLREHLVGPLADRIQALGFSGAVLVPAGRLSLLPLPAAAGDGPTISLAPSARVLQAVTAARDHATNLPAALVGVGNPLPVADPMVPLDFAEAEVAAVASLFGAGPSPLVREQATRQGLLALLPTATHVHLACHGAFNSNEPLDSALYLGGRDRLTLRDLLDGDLDLSRARLAVLSACQTGLTESSRVPDEVIGLPAGFLHAGVTGVVATLWPVNEVSTAVLVTEFYRLLIKERLDPADALRQAQAYLRDSTPGELGLADWFDRVYAQSGGTDVIAFELAAAYRAHPDAPAPFAHPLYWAGFTYTGE